VNRFILRHKYLVTFVILATLAWSIYRQFIVVRSPLLPFAAVVAAVWGLGTFAFIYYWPAITYTGFKRAITRGVDANTSSGIPINTLYAVPTLASPSTRGAGIMTTGTDYLLYVLGWLDLSTGAHVLHVPAFSGRYYSVQFTDPSDGAAFAYVGTRATGSAAGDYLVTGTDWNGDVPSGVTRIPCPNNAVAVIGRVLVENGSDLPAAYGLAKQIRVTPLNERKPASGTAPGPPPDHED
jgi:hypothetical protein